MKPFALVLILILCFAPEASAAPLATAHLSLAQAALDLAVDKLVLGPNDPIGASYQLDGVRVELAAAGETLDDPEALREIRALRIQATEISEVIGKRQAKALPLLARLSRSLELLRRDLFTRKGIS
ncbi:MAG TPA: hypothetical protein DD435_01600 [Cyanobacteria bacterium UBA8530]|nr:hypothetical protein [Cyanobacteria bacterium UBA8530]